MNISPLTDKINLVFGAIGAFLAYLLGEHWSLFVFFLLLNVADFITRWIAARLTGTENSKAGSRGVLKKLGYWIMIALGYGMSVMFIEIGKVINVDLSITTYIGLFVLLTLIINEIRSILENLVDAGYKPPAVLIKGLEVANNAIDDAIKIDNEEVEEVLHGTEDD